MRVGKHLNALFLSVVSLIAVLPGARGAEPAKPVRHAQSYGTIVGIVADAAKQPVAGATVTAVRAGGGIRSTISNSDGVYSFADVPSGSWSLTTTVEGFPDVVGPAISVMANKATRHDVAMNGSAHETSAPVLAAAPPAPPAP